ALPFELRARGFGFLDTLGRSQEAARLTEGFRAGVTEERFGGGVPADDAPVERVPDDGDGGGLHQRSECFPDDVIASPRRVPLPAVMRVHAPPPPAAWLRRRSVGVER